MRDFCFGKVSDVRVMRSPKFFDFYIQIFRWYFEAVI